MAGYFIVLAFLLLGGISVWQALQLKKEGNKEKYKMSLGVGVIFCVLAVTNIVLIVFGII